MATKTVRKQKTRSNAKQASGERKPSSKTVIHTVPSWIIPTLLIITFFSYIPALSAGFVNWDDPDYVNNNLFIKNLDPAFLLKPLQGNYHPVTLLSLAINYAISGMDAWSYHLFNVLFHLGNVFLVFRLAMQLSTNNLIIAFTTAIFFAIHPMHVESVAWVSERKDLLYSLFFLLGLGSYTKYVDTGGRKYYWYALLWLVLSLLSKPAAVIFPIALFSIDVLRGRKLSVKLATEKIVFLIPAIVIGMLTYMAQKANQSVDEQFFNGATRIFFGFYGIMIYFVKMILPFNLATFYPYPALNESLPLEYYISPVFFLCLVALCAFTWKKNKVFTFGISFYIINLLLVLQFVPVGSAIIADRYTYIPYIGLFYIAGWLLDFYARLDNSKAIIVLTPLSLIFAALTFQQAKTWNSSASLWDQAIKAQPSANAYGLRASLFRAEKKYDQALEYYNEGINRNAIFYEGYTNRGNIYFDLKKWDLAYADYRKALSIKPDYYPALDNLGAWFGVHNQFDSALYYLNKALAIKPDYTPSLSNRALALTSLKRYDEAVTAWKNLLQYEPDAADIYNSIGTCYQNLGNYNESLIWINRAIEKINDPSFYLNRAYTYYYLKNVQQAKKDAIIARQNGEKIEPGFAASLGIQ